MQLCYCNSQKNFTKKCFKSTFVMHFSAFQDFQNEIIFQYSKISYNNKVNFCELSDVFKSYFLNIFLDVGGPSLFSKVQQAMNLTLLVRNQSCTIYGVLANCAQAYLGPGLKMTRKFTMKKTAVEFQNIFLKLYLFSPFVYFCLFIKCSYNWKSSTLIGAYFNGISIFEFPT